MTVFKEKKKYVGKHSLNVIIVLQNIALKCLKDLWKKNKKLSNFKREERGLKSGPWP